MAEFNLVSTPKDRRAAERGDLPLDAREVLELLDYVRDAITLHSRSDLG